MTPAQKWELLKKRFQKTTKKPHQHTESSLQIECVKWVRATFPHFDKLFFSVPNGGQRNATTARIMKAEGVVAGVSDLMLLMANHGYHGLCIEMKTEKGRQSEHQRIFQTQAEYNGYKYVVCRSFDEFASEINRYQMTWVVTDELLELCGFYRVQTDEKVTYRHKIHKDIELRKYHGFFYTDILGKETLIRKVEHLMMLLVIAGKGDVADNMRRNEDIAISRKESRIINKFGGEALFGNHLLVSQAKAQAQAQAIYLQPTQKEKEIINKLNKQQL